MDDKETQVVDNHQLAEDVSSKINYEFAKDFLVKPLDPVMVKKEFSKPVETKEAVKDENGIEAVDYEEVETEVKEVESDFTKGIVLKVPHSYKLQLADDKYAPMDIKVGDVVIFQGRKKYFDLCKDTMLVASYDIVGIEK